MDITLAKIYERSLIMRLLLIGILCAVIFYLGYFFDLSELSSALQTSKSQEETLKTDLKTNLKKQNKLNNEISTYANLPTTLQQLQKKLIIDSAMPELMNEIVKIGTAHHLQFILFTPGPTVKNDIYKMIPIKVVVAGDYSDISGFLSEIANYPTLISIGNYTISTPDSETSKDAATAETPSPKTSLLNAELILEVYYLAEQNQKAKI